MAYTGNMWSSIRPTSIFSQFVRSMCKSKPTPQVWTISHVIYNAYSTSPSHRFYMLTFAMTAIPMIMDLWCFLRTIVRRLNFAIQVQALTRLQDLSSLCWVDIQLPVHVPWVPIDPTNSDYWCPLNPMPAVSIGPLFSSPMYPSLPHILSTVLGTWCLHTGL